MNYRTSCQGVAGEIGESSSWRRHHLSSAKCRLTVCFPGRGCKRGLHLTRHACAPLRIEHPPFPHDTDAKSSNSSSPAQTLRRHEHPHHKPRLSTHWTLGGAGHGRGDVAYVTLVVERAGVTVRIRSDESAIGWVWDGILQ